MISNLRSSENAPEKQLEKKLQEKQLQYFTEMIKIRSFIFLTIYVPILRVWMGEDKGQLSVKILAICQLLVTNFRLFVTYQLNDY